MTLRADLQAAQAARVARRESSDVSRQAPLDTFARALALAETGKPGTNWKQVSPEHRKRLAGLLKFYAKKKHPFAACVRDNRKRFGDRAENVCAVLKDMIRGTTRWRAGGEHDKGVKLSERGPMDEADVEFFEGLDDETIGRIVDELESDS